MTRDRVQNFRLWWMIVSAALAAVLSVVWFGWHGLVVLFLWGTSLLAQTAYNEAKDRGRVSGSPTPTEH